MSTPIILGRVDVRCFVCDRDHCAENPLLVVVVDGASAVMCERCAMEANS